MDRVGLEQRIKKWFGRYRYGLLVVALGIFLMMLPTGTDHTPQSGTSEAAQAENTSVSDELADILSQIRGVGKVRVMITEAAGAETVYQTDEDTTDEPDASTRRTETVVISGKESETGLVRTVTPPTYLGAIVVCQGGDDPSVRLAVSQAVSAVTGISTDRITVLKMK